MKEGVPSAFREWLLRRLGNGAALIFAGYGAVDSFDVTPFFDAIDVTLSASSAVFITHNDAALPVGGPRLLRPFSTRVHEAGRPTASVLCELAAPYGVAVGDDRDSERWRGYFRRSASMQALPQVRAFLVLGLCLALGLAPSRIDPGAIAEAIRNRREFRGEHRRRFHWRLGLANRAEGRMLRETWQYFLGGPSDEALASWLNARGLRLGGRSDGGRLRAALEADLERQGQLTWDFTTRLAAHSEALLRSFSHPHSRADGPARDSVKILCALLDEIDQLDLQSVAYVNQSALMLRKRAMLGALLGEDPHAFLQRALELYADSASLDGFVGTFRDRARAMLLCAPRLGTSAVAEASEWARHAVDAASIIGVPRQVACSRALVGRVATWKR